MILVTGGTGLLGGHLLLELIRQNQPVKALIRNGGDPRKVLSIWKHYHVQPESLLEKVEWLSVDLTNKSELLEILKEGDELYHCAGKVSFNSSDKEEMYNSNVEATSNIVNACLETGNLRLLYVSSIAAIGYSDRDILTEQSGWPSKSRSIYSRTKTLGELEVWRGIVEGLDAVIINPSVILGTGHWKGSSARFFDVIYKGLSYYTLGETGFVDVLDVVNIMIRLMKSEIAGERFILNAENLNYKTLFEKIADALQVNPPQKYASPAKTSIAWKIEYVKHLVTGKDPRITNQSAQSSHRRKNYSAEKIQKTLGVKFQSIDNTIDRIANNYLADQQSKNQS